jgi:hypothetical protein
MIRTNSYEIRGGGLPRRSTADDGSRFVLQKRALLLSNTNGREYPRISPSLAS